jgi:Tol biopolymer transport system component
MGAHIFTTTRRAALGFVMVALLAACSGGDQKGTDSKKEAQPTPGASSLTTKATAAPLGGGELIVFDRLVPGEEEDRELYAVGPDGGKPRLLRSPGNFPHWSPDGSKLAFLACLNSPDCTTGVALIERSTGEVHGFTMPDPDLYTSCAIWAPSGKTLACEGGSESDPKRNGIYTVRASDGNGLTRITRNPGALDFPLTYSPDGRQLLFSREPPSGDESEPALFVTPAGGGKPHRITPWGLSDDSASWSPDGSTIVFGTSGYLYRVSPDGKGLAKIAVQTPDGSAATHAFDVSFSPDGRRIVFSLGGAEPGIYVADPDGSNVKRLTTSPTEDHHANWGTSPGS